MCIVERILNTLTLVTPTSPRASMNISLKLAILDILGLVPPRYVWATSADHDRRQQT